MRDTGERGMSDTQVLLSKIAALRQRLEQAQGLGHRERGEQKSEATLPMSAGIGSARYRVRALEKSVAAGAWHNTLLDGTLRPVTEAPAPAEAAPGLPRQLTARARRLLEQGRDLLARLRGLADEPLLQLDAHPLAVRYRDTVAMADTALRMVQAYPDAPTAQLRLCEGLEATLCVIAERLGALIEAVEQRRLETGRLDTLADLLSALAAGQPVELQQFTTLAEALLEDAARAAPLHFYAAAADQPARFIAAHALVTAQVAARLVKHDPELRGRALDPVLAALVHDVGMLRTPAEALAQVAPWTDAQRRAVEGHPRVSAELVAKLSPEAAWLVEASACHHERLDGTGYPAGLREMQIPPLVRLLQVCDVYAALCCPRPHRAALDPRTALTDTLLLAEKGVLDRHQAEHLLQLSFYPVGSVVELADGAVGVVVATHTGRRDLNAPARPIVALLTTPQGEPLPRPRHVDLAWWEGGSIVRTLPQDERRQLLGKSYPEIA